MPLPKKSIAFATSAFLAASALTIVAATASTSASDPITCDANVVSLVVGNGSNQYFECVDSSAGAIRQTFSSKNPWIVDPAAPALFITPPATPDGAYGQIFTGRVQGVGVISSDDDTGAERDSISRNETLTFKKDALARNFSGLQLGVNVLQAGTNITVQAIDADGADITGGTAVSGSLSTGSRNVTFFSDVPVDAAGFRIGVTSGAFSLDGKRQTEFSLSEPDVTPPDPVTNLKAVPNVTSIELSWENPGAGDLKEIIVRRAEGDKAPGEVIAGDPVTVPAASQPATSVTDTKLKPDTQYSYAVFARDKSGNTSVATVITETTKPPTPVSDLEVTGVGAFSVSLKWTNPTDPGLTEIIVRRAQEAAPATADDGEAVLAALSTSVTDDGLDPGTEYFYSVFARYDDTYDSGPVWTSEATLQTITENRPSTESETFGDQTLTSVVEFEKTDSCKATEIPIIDHSVSDVDFDLYTLSANWVVPDKDDIIPNTSPEITYGNCLFRWTTQAVGVDYSLTPLMDYDGDDGPKLPEAIPGCVYDEAGLVLPPKLYVGDDRPFCLVSDNFDGESATKTTTVLVWNDPKRFT
jgi:chitodextrinase